MLLLGKSRERYKTFARMDRLTKQKLPCFRESQPLLLQKQTVFFSTGLWKLIAQNNHKKASLMVVPVFQ